MKIHALSVAALVLFLGPVNLSCAPDTPKDEPAARTDDKTDSTSSEDQQSSEGRADLLKKMKSKNAVLKALADTDFFNAEPNLKAKCFIYLQSASWCAPCCAEMPHIVELYPTLKKAKVEIILVGFDSGKDAAKKYLEKFKAPFPGIMLNEGSALPGFTKAQGIPHCTFVNAKGKVLYDGHASHILSDWKTIIKKH